MTAVNVRTTPFRIGTKMGVVGQGAPLARTEPRELRTRRPEGRSMSQTDSGAAQACCRITSGPGTVTETSRPEGPASSATGRTTMRQP